jgi:hypothetical protein
MTNMTLITDKIKRRSGLRDLRTAVTSRIRSKPTIEGQRYLDLYVLQRDRFRWKRLMEQAQRSIGAIDMALRKLGFNPDFGHEGAEQQVAEVQRAADASRSPCITMKHKKAA